MNYETLEYKVTEWAKGQDEVQALVVIGSRAREDHTADDLSDLDLILFVTDQQVYVSDSSWLAAFGEVWLQFLNYTGAGDPEWQVLFAGDLKVDFLLAPYSGDLAYMLFSSYYAVAARRGVRVLLDKRVGAELISPKLESKSEWNKPGPEEFTAVLVQFWLGAYRVAHMLKRSELWRARMITDGLLRQILQKMLEWHAKARWGDGFDTWYDGRFLEEWADPQALVMLPQTFALFDGEDSNRALLALITLMNRLGRETAARWQILYPGATELRIRERIEVLLPLEKAI